MPRLDFKMQRQQHTEWCWAAVAVSVKLYFDSGSGWCQCRLASRMAELRPKLKVKNCGSCRSPDNVPRVCNQPWYLGRALQLVGCLKGKNKPRSLTFKQIEERIGAKRPVCARIQWRKGGAHFVAISGCDTHRKSGNQWVDIKDPFAGSSIWLYEEFRSNYSYAGSWDETFSV